MNWLAYFFATVWTVFSKGLFCLTTMRTAICEFYIQSTNEKDYKGNQPYVCFCCDKVIVIDQFQSHKAPINCKNGDGNYRQPFSNFFHTITPSPYPSFLPVSFILPKQQRRYKNSPDRNPVGTVALYDYFTVTAVMCGFTPSYQ